MIVYCLTNLLNGKRYVGQTTRSLDARLKEHCSSLATGVDPSIAAFGIRNFKAEILQTCHSREELDQAERHWIAKLNTLQPNGYNRAPGGYLTKRPRKPRLNRDGACVAHISR